MILELADIRIQAGQQAAFDEVISRALKEVVCKAPGFLGYSIHKGIENPERYLLQISWETLEHHTVGFRGSAAFLQWRELVGPYFSSPPTVEHFDVLVPAS